jgi:hypothetical protein
MSGRKEIKKSGNLILFDITNIWISGYLDIWIYISNIPTFSPIKRKSPPKKKA